MHCCSKITFEKDVIKNERWTQDVDTRGDGTKLILSVNEEKN